MDSIKSKIESILFVSNKPVDIKTLVKITESTVEEVIRSAEELKNDRKESGIVILENAGTYQLATNSENTQTVTNFLNTDLREKLTDATVEVLAIIAYRQPISRAEIEAIRGVNSQYSIRHLLMRGMIEKAPNPGDARGSLYQVTTEFLQHMGITSLADLPSFEDLTAQIKLPETPGLENTKVAETVDAVKIIEPTENSDQKEDSQNEESSTPPILEVSETVTTVAEETPIPPAITKNESNNIETKESSPHPQELIEAPDELEELPAPPSSPNNHNLRPPLPPKIQIKNITE